MRVPSGYEYRGLIMIIGEKIDESYLDKGGMILYFVKE